MMVKERKAADPSTATFALWLVEASLAVGWIKIVALGIAIHALNGGSGSAAPVKAVGKKRTMSAANSCENFRRG